MLKKIKTEGLAAGLVAIVTVFLFLPNTRTSQDFSSSIKIPKILLTEQDRAQLNSFIRKAQEHPEEIFAPLIKSAVITALDFSDIQLMHKAYALLFKVYSAVSETLSSVDREKLKDVVKMARDIILPVNVDLTPIEQLKALEQRVQGLRGQIQNFIQNVPLSLTLDKQSLMEDALKAIGMVYEHVKNKINKTGDSEKKLLGEGTATKPLPPISTAGRKFAASSGGDLLSEIRSRPQLRPTPTTPKTQPAPVSDNDLLAAIRSKPKLKPVVVPEKPKVPQKEPSMMDLLKQELNERRSKLEAEEPEEEEYDFS